MRTLTKTGIRILSAKYRSILRKCAILNAMVLMLGVSSAMAEDMTWSGLKSAVDGTAETINVTGYITRGANDEDITISRELSIIGSETGSYLDGGYVATTPESGYKGLTVDTGGNLTLQNITMQNFKNISTVGGAIQNKGTIESITGDFIGNTSTTKNGGAISNTGTIKSITGNFKDNSANSGGAISNSQNKEINFVAENGKNIEFDGNYVTSSSSSSSTNGKGGAIYNFSGTVGLCAETGSSITFVGGENVENSKYDIDGIFNVGILNINGNGNGTKTYSGTVNLYTVSDNSTPMGTTNIYGGTVNVAKDITQNNINVKSGAKLNSTGNIKVTEYLTNDGTVSVYGIEGKIKNNTGGLLTFNDTTAIVDIDLTNSGTVNFNGQLNAPDFNFILTQNAGTMNFSTTAIESTAEYGKINTFTMNGGSVNIADGSVNTLHINQLNLAGNTNFAMDADLAGEKMDKIQIHGISGSEIAEGKVINIDRINLLSATEKDKVSLDLFADEDTQNALINNVHANINGLQYSSIYKYDANYDDTEGKITFTRYNSGTSDDFNPYIYAPSVAAQTTANITGQIATLAMDKMDDVVHAQGRSGGDTTTSSNAWVKVMGLNDNVEFNNFENIDSKALTVAAGYNTDKITCGNCGIVLGAYAGYIGGKQQYTGNDIDQNGGYVGLSSALTLGDAFLTATVNGGLLNNKANNMYGTDRFNTLWLGAGLKTGYNYAITDSVVLQPNVYGGYTLVNTEDYTSVSGVKIATHNLNFFEIDPGLKLSAAIADGWTTSVQGKYAIVMDNGADITVNDIALQNISTKNYIEYGIGIDKSLTDTFYLGAKINRHDVGRTGWNGSIEFKYKF